MSRPAASGPSGKSSSTWLGMWITESALGAGPVGADGRMETTRQSERLPR